MTKYVIPYVTPPNGAISGKGKLARLLRQQKARQLGFVRCIALGGAPVRREDPALEKKMAFSLEDTFKS